MAKTVGCSDFSQPCSFRVTADDGQENAMVDIVSSHAAKYHPELAVAQPQFREAIKSHIHDLMAQAHMSPADIAEV